MKYEPNYYMHIISNNVDQKQQLFLNNIEHTYSEAYIMLQLLITKKIGIYITE